MLLQQFLRPLLLGLTNRRKNGQADRRTEPADKHQSGNGKSLTKQNASEKAQEQL